MNSRPDAVGHIAAPTTRVAVILELIDRVLAECEPQLLQLRTAVDDLSAHAANSPPRAVLPARGVGT